MEDDMNPIRIGVTLLVIALTAPTALPAGAPQKGSSKYEPHTHQHDCHKHRKHCHHCDAPFAPILGSAPAMMAPIVLTRAQQRPKHAEVEPEDRLSELKELVLLLDELTPQRTTSAAPAAPSSVALEETLTRLGRQISSLEKAQNTLTDRLDRSLGLMNGTVDEMKKMQLRIQGIQERLDGLER